MVLNLGTNPKLINPLNPRTFKGEWAAGFNIHRRHSDKKIVGYPCMYDADEREFLDFPFSS